MSHELRTPLNAVLGYSEFARRRHLRTDTREGGRVLERIQSNGKHLLGFQRCADLSKIEPVN